MTKLLLNEAKKKPLQYTFLTPQDTSEIKQSKDLSILRYVLDLTLSISIKLSLKHLCAN